MSHPPEYPGRHRLKRVAAAAGSDAYQGAFEAVGAVLVGCGLGYWADRSWETAPFGVLIGAVLGFAAMVLRLLRLGKELHPDPSGEAGEVDGMRGAEVTDDRAVGESPGISDVLREDEGDEVAPSRDGSDERK